MDRIWAIGSSGRAIHPGFLPVPHDGEGDGLFILVGPEDPEEVPGVLNWSPSVESSSTSMTRTPDSVEK